jgi:hypothetical protein
MSNSQSKMIDALIASPARRKPGAWILVFAVIYPAAVIAIELIWKLCASVLFDPMPTFWHVLVVSFVPASNLLAFNHLRSDAPRHSVWFAFANGAAIAIAGLYALLFVPVLPLAIVGIPFGIGLLPFAPLAGFVGALALRAAWPTDRLLRRPVLAGLAGGIALLLALDVPSAATRLGVQWAVSSEPAERERGLTLLRTIGDDDLLLRLCYDAVGRPTGLLSAFVVFGNGMWLEWSPHSGWFSASIRSVAVAPISFSFGVPAGPAGSLSQPGNNRRPPDRAGTAQRDEAAVARGNAA